MQCIGESGFSVHVSEFRSQLPDCSLHMSPQLKAKDSIVLSAAMKRLALLFQASLTEMNG